MTGNGKTLLARVVLALACGLFTIGGLGCGGDDTEIYCDGDGIRWESPRSSGFYDCIDLCEVCYPESTAQSTACEDDGGDPYCPCPPTRNVVMCESGDDVRNICDSTTCP